MEINVDYFGLLLLHNIIIITPLIEYQNWIFVQHTTTANDQDLTQQHLSNSGWHYYLRYSFLHYRLRYSFSMFVIMTSENRMMSIVKRRWGTILACEVRSGHKCVVMFTNKNDGRLRHVDKQDDGHGYRRNL